MKNKVAIVSSKYYENIAEGLIKGATDKLNPSFDVEVFLVDGAWELIYKINELSKNNSFNKFIAIGVIVKGDTDHYEYISKGVADGLINLTIHNNIYIANCVLNVLNLEQANERISDNKNKGSEAATAINNLFL
jgi:6,7-dimethyl-8-ribityllumazine synthase